MNTLLYSNRVNIPNPVKQLQVPNTPIGIGNMFSNIRGRRPTITPTITPNPPLKTMVQGSETGDKKIKWGEPTWYLLHTMSYKVKNNVFPQIKNELLNIIYTICTNLPCPSCSEHARQYLDRINVRGIQTKEDLKIALFNFHNEVNKKKGYPIFLYDDCEAKYSKAIPINIIQNFMPYFADKSRSPKLMASDFQKSYIVKMLKEWFQKNIGVFEN